MILGFLELVSNKKVAQSLTSVQCWAKKILMQVRLANCN